MKKCVIPLSEPLDESLAKMWNGFKKLIYTGAEGVLSQHEKQNREQKHIWFLCLMAYQLFLGY